MDQLIASRLDEFMDENGRPDRAFWGTEQKDGCVDEQSKHDEIDFMKPIRM